MSLARLCHSATRVAGVRFLSKTTVSTLGEKPFSSVKNSAVEDSGVARRGKAPLGATIKEEVLTGFDEMWCRLKPEEQYSLWLQHKEAYKSDWKTLSLNQWSNLYTMRFGVPVKVDRFHWRKVFLGTVLTVGFGLFLFGVARYFAKPRIPSLDPAYQIALEDYMRQQNMNPIFGISSKTKQSTPSIDDLDFK
jgi:hypothetical protein